MGRLERTREVCFGRKGVDRSPIERAGKREGRDYDGGTSIKRNALESMELPAKQME